MASMLQRFLPFLITSLLLACVSGCGFQLRGSTALPFKTLSINVGDTSPVAVGIKREIRGNGPTQIVATSAPAEARLEILGESLRTDILTINSLGAAAEYNLYYHLRFRVTDDKKHIYIPVTELTLKRLVLANSNAQLAENFEISQLTTDMQSDAAQQVVRRLEAIKPGHFLGTESDIDEKAGAGPEVPLNQQLVAPLTAPGS
jgi:LPS-assembly lipoprotein